MTAPTSESPQPVQPDPVVGVNDWGRASDAWERVFDDLTAIGADLKTVFKGAYQAAAVDPGVDLSDAVGGLAAEQFVGVSERLDRGLAGARAAMGMLGDELHDGGSDRLHGEVEGAVKVSLYELGMLMIRMSDKLDGDVPPPRQPRVATAPATNLPSDVGVEPLPAYAAATARGEVAAEVVVRSSVPAGDATEEIPEIDVTDPAPHPDDTVTPVPDPIPVRPAPEPGPDLGNVIRPD